MSKKIFICGKVYDLTVQNQATIEQKIQKRVDAICNDPDNADERLVSFHLDVDWVTLDIKFVFQRNNLFAKEGTNPEFINDSDGQLLMGMDGRFKPPVMWDLVEPFAPSRYHIPLSEFVYAYVESAQKLGAADIIGLQIESSKTELKLKIRV